MNVKEIVKYWLEGNGYDGLYSEECGCELADFMPCGSELIELCKPGYKTRCNCNDDDEDGNSEPEHKFHIGPKRDS